MREYSLLDEDYVSLVTLNGVLIENPAKGSLTLGSDNFLFESHIVEKSSLDGAVKIGSTRVASRDVTLSFQQALGADDSDFRAAENALIKFFQAAAYLYDVTNSLRIPVSVLEYNLDYSAGSYQLSSDNEIRLKLLNPTWESSVVTQYTDSLAIDLNEIAIVNDGFAEVFPVITFEAAAAVENIKMFVYETRRGLIIEDPLFGPGDYDTLIIDCKAGTIDLIGLDRTIYMFPGTGYFPFPIGTSTFNILPSAVCDITVDFYKRYFI